MKFTFTGLSFFAVFGLFSPFLVAAPLSPVQTKVVAVYKIGPTISKQMVVDSTGYSGAVDFDSSVLFSSLGGLVPDLSGTNNASVKLYGRNNDTVSLGSPVTLLDEMTLVSWVPTIGIRWTNTFAFGGPVKGNSDSFVLQKPTGVYTPVINTSLFGVAGIKPVATRLITRMDWPSTISISATIKDTVTRYLVVRKFWYPYNLNTWSLDLPSGQVAESTLTNSTSYNYTKGIRAITATFEQKMTLAAYSGSGNPLLNNYTNYSPQIAIYPGNQLAANFKTTAGREVWTVELESFSPGNTEFLTRDQGMFFIDAYPQPSGVVTVPVDKLVNGSARINGSSKWSPTVAINNIFPGGEIYAEFIGINPVRPPQIVASISKAPSDPLGLPSNYVGVVDQKELIPLVPNPIGTYRLNIFHDFNGTSELVASMDYFVDDQITVNANIVEIVKPDN